MNKIYFKTVLIFAFFSITASFLQAQNRINQVLDNVSTANFVKISPFSLNQTAIVSDNIFEGNYKPIMLTIEPIALQSLNSQSKFLEINLPISTKENLILELYEANIFAETFKVINSDGKEVSSEKGLHYRGRIKGDKQSICALSIINGEVSGFISDKTGNQNLKKLQNGTYTLYNETKLLDKTGFKCGIVEEAFSLPPTPNAVAGVGCKIVDIYIEADNQMYINNGSSIPNTSADVTSKFNQVATLYTNENIEIRISLIKVWNTLEPYNGADAGAVLPQFRAAVGTSFTGNLAHLFAGRSLGGGVAYLNVLNSKANAFGVSVMSFGGYFNGGFSTSPIGEITHEIGHNIGSPHTHNCAAWNSGAGIDNCAGTYNAIYAEGTCTPANPPAGGGTIMSYCHLLSAIGTNYANGFGTLPGNLVRAKVLAGTSLASSAPAAPTTVGASRCDAGTLSLTASNCVGGTVLWYNAATGGTSIGTGFTFTTPSISTTTNYYASCTIGACESTTRTLTAASIVPISAPTGSSVSRCGTGGVTLIASGCSGGTIRWYGSLTGTAVLSSAAGYAVSVSTTTSFYASCTIGSCVSSRTTFTATVNTPPVAPVITSASRCGTGVLNLSATCPSGGVPNWYDFAGLDPEPFLVATGNTYSPTLSASDSYTVVCYNALCSSNGTATATVNSVPATPTVSSITIASGMATSLTASGTCLGTIQWFSNGTTATPFSTGTTYTTPVLTTNSTYHFACNSGFCSSPRGSVLVSVSACPPTITMVSPVNNLISGTNPYETSGTFIGRNQITGGNTKYDSATSIILDPGFSVSGGAVFRAIIDGCGGSY